MKKQPKTSDLGQDIIASLKEGLQHAQGKIELRSSTISLPDEPPKMSKKLVKDIRKELNVSQAVLARYIGVSASVVRAWEQGQSKPNGSASRLLQIAAAQPKAFLMMVSILGRKEEKAYFRGLESVFLKKITY
ncbi:MAG: helix-turn-helix domain-containing protein [Pseudobdellovibrionaceae bacterium]